MTAKTKAPTTSLIKCTPDITRTQAMIAARTASKMPVNHKGEAAGEHIKTVNAIINAEKLDKINKGKLPSDCAPGTQIHTLINKLKPYLIDM